MIAPEFTPTCGDCAEEITPANEAPCERDWLCLTCWATCTRCRGNQCGHEGDAA